MFEWILLASLLHDMESHAIYLKHFRIVIYATSKVHCRLKCVIKIKIFTIRVLVNKKFSNEVSVDIYVLQNIFNLFTNCF